MQGKRRVSKSLTSRHLCAGFWTPFRGACACADYIFFFFFFSLSLGKWKKRALVFCSVGHRVANSVSGEVLFAIQKKLEKVPRPGQKEKSIFKKTILQLSAHLSVDQNKNQASWKIVRRKKQKGLENLFSSFFLKK